MAHAEVARVSQPTMDQYDSYERHSQLSDASSYPVKICQRPR